MKKALIAAGLVACMLGGRLAAQDVHSQIALSRAEIETDRQAIVAATLALDEAHGKAFWGLYRDYRAEMDKPIGRIWKLFVDYGENWQTLTDANGAKLLTEYLAAEDQALHVKQKWASKITKALGGANAARFFQIDNKLDTIIRLETAASIPLIEKAK
jgi:hypothetical protein